MPWFLKIARCNYEQENSINKQGGTTIQVDWDKRMAYRKKPKLQSITTADILRKLKQVTDKGGDNTEFFFLYVSTAGKKQRRRQKRTQPLLKGQQLLSFTPQRNHTVRDDPAEYDDHRQ